jgi:hypothetical protein
MVFRTLLAVLLPDVAHAFPPCVLVVALRADDVTDLGMEALRHVGTGLGVKLEAGVTEVVRGTNAFTVVGDRKPFTGALTSWVTHIMNGCGQFPSIQWTLTTSPHLSTY